MSSTKRVTFLIDAQDNASSKMKAVGESAKRLEQSTKQVGDSFKQFSVFGLAATATATGLLYKMADLTKTMLVNAGSMEQNRIAFDTMLGSADQARSLLKQLSDFARQTPFDLPQLVEGSKKLLAYGSAAADIIPTMEALGNISAGVGREKLPQLILAFGQVQTATRLTGMELRQFTEAGVPLLDALSAQSGKSAAQIKSDMEAGVAPSFEEVQKAIFDMSKEGGKFFNLMEKQSQTFDGQMSNMRDNLFRLGNAVVGVSDTGDIIKGGFFDVIRKSVFDVNNSLNDNFNKIVQWGSAIINSFYALGRTISNAIQIIFKGIVGFIDIAVQSAYDGIETIKNFLSGDFTISTENTKAAIDDLSAGIQGDMTDMASGWLDAADAVGAATSSSGKDMAELATGTKKMASDVSAGAEKMAEKMESFAKKIKEAKEKISDLRKEFKDSQKDLKAEYLENVENNKKALGDSVAQKLYDKETKLTELKSELMIEETDARKAELDAQIKEIEKFLDDHKQDYTQYSKELKSLREYNALDEIEQLKVDFAIKQAEIKKQYDEDLADLKDQYKKRKKELEKHLEDIKDELKKFMNSKTVKDATKLGVKVDVQARAMGGPVEGGSPYLVGEQGPELFVPKGAGSIVPNNKMGANITVNFYGDINDEDKLISRIKGVINRELELNQFGIG